MIFTLLYLGFEPRIASETFDSAQSRMTRILSLIGDCTFSIHDLSRISSSKKGEPSRFNMPFELGVDYGSKCFTTGPLQNKKFLILETEKYRYHKSLSDLSGHDIKHHSNNPAHIPKIIRDWLISDIDGPSIKGPSAIWYSFIDFQACLHDRLISQGHSEDDITGLPIPQFIGEVKAYLS